MLHLPVLAFLTWTEPALICINNLEEDLGLCPDAMTTKKMLRRHCMPCCRCHPDLAALPNKWFYDGRLVNGCTPNERASLVPGLRALVYVEVRGQQQQGSGGSLSNHAEATAVVAALGQLSDAGISSAAMGVICFYRAQVVIKSSILSLVCSQHSRGCCNEACHPLKFGKVPLIQNTGCDNSAVLCHSCSL